MPYPYLEAHTVDALGADRGSYSQVICPFRNISSAHNAVEIHHSLFEGDRMTFFQILTERKDALDRTRPIRFYNNDPVSGGVKLFDGRITNTKYAYIGGDYMALKVDAAGWWRELAGMDLHHPITYAEADNWSVDDIYMDLVKLANDYGMRKEAIYVYDTDKIPDYTPWDSYFAANIEADIIVTNVYEGMKLLTRVLDVIVPSAFEFGLRIEALPRTTDDLVNPIDQADTEDSIYILPILLDQTKATVASFKRFKLAAGVNGYNVRRDYKRLANDCFATGSGYNSRQIRTIEGQEATTQILESVDIPDSDEYFSPDNQPLTSHYLRVTIKNPVEIPVSGTVAITFDDGVSPDPVTKITDYLYFDLSPAPGGHPAIQTQFTSILSHDGITLPTTPPWGIHVTGFGGWTPKIKISIDEVSNAILPYSTLIAGKSVNTYGHAPHRITDMWLNSQARVDLAAGKQCRLYHSPIHDLYAPIIARYVSYDNLIGNTAEFYSPYDAAVTDFMITDAIYGFRGKLITQHLMGMRHEYDWEYDDTYIYVMVGTDYVMVGTDKVTI